MKKDSEKREPLINILHDTSRMTGLLRDSVSKLKQAEVMLRSNEERYRVYFNHVNDIMFSLDRQLLCRFVTPNVERIMGYIPEELIGKSFADTHLVHPDDFQEAIENAQYAMTGGVLRSAVLRLFTKDGVCKLAEMSAFPIKQNGQTEEVVYIARDITGRVEGL
jgi:PAS domain S-box-containing protein